MEENLKKLLIKKDTSNKIIFHIDVNSAYLSWTAVNLLKTSNKDIRLIPSIIGGDETKRSGVVLARSNPAKKLGIKTGEPVYFAMQKVPNLEIYPANFVLYEKMSADFNSILSKYTAIIEKYSIDESFLDVTDYLLGKTALELAKTIKDDIFNSLGFTVNIGISNVKLLAKTASDFKKPNMIHTLYSNEIEKKLWPLDISNLFTVGRKTQSILRKMQINTIRDIAISNPIDLKNKLGKHGIEIWKLANGIDDSEVVSENLQAKSISNAETLPSNIKDIGLIKNHILKIVEKIANNLRNENLLCKTIRLTLRDKNFKDRSKQKSLKEHTNNTKLIYETAIEILNDMFDNYEVRLIGVSLDNLILNSNIQIDLFSIKEENKKDIKSIKRKNCKNIKEEKLDFVLDKINKQYNDNIIKRARNTKANKNKEKKDN